MSGVDARRVGLFRLSAQAALFYGAYLLYCISQIIGMVNLDVVFGIGRNVLSNTLLVVVVGLLTLKMLFQRYDGKSLLAMIAILFVAALTVFVTGAGQLFASIAFICAGQDISLQGVAKVALLSFSIGTAVIVLASSFGLMPSVIVAGSDGAFRYSHGFQNVNQLGKSMTVISLAYTVLRFDAFKIKDYFLVILLAVVSYALSRSRTSLMVSLIIVVLLFVFKNFSLSTIVKAMRVAFPLMFAGSIIVAVIYSNAPGVFEALNSVLSGRIWSANWYYVHYGVTLFGSNILGEWFSIDNAYCRVLFQYGLCSAIITYVACRSLLKHFMAGDGTADLIFCWATMILIALSEAYVLQVDNNFALLAFSSLLYASPVSAFSKQRTNLLE